MPYLKKVGLLAVWLVLSFELLLLLERVARMRSPGFLLAALAASVISRADVRWVIGPVLWLGIDFGLCFAAVYGLYVLFTWLLRHVEK
jgi:hypothetical protein